MLSGADIAASVQPIASLTRTEPFEIPNRDGSLMPEPDQRALQANYEDVQFRAGEFEISDTGRRVSLFEVAAFAQSSAQPRSADADFEQQRESYSSGCHV